MQYRNWNRIAAGLVWATSMPLVARAEVYLTEENAAAILFPGLDLKPRWIELTANDIKAIEKDSGERVSERRVRLWTGPHGEALIVDRVLGKHQFITYAVALAPDVTVKAIEIMDYRETYGYEIRRPEWRRQFVGKSAHAPLKLDRDIKNISGATLSSAHVTNGVRRVLKTYELIKKKI